MKMIQFYFFLTKIFIPYQNFPSNSPDVTIFHEDILKADSDPLRKTFNSSSNLLMNKKPCDYQNKIGDKLNSSLSYNWIGKYIAQKYSNWQAGQ